MQPLMQRKNRRTPGAPVAFILALLLCACSGEIPPIAPLAQDAIVLAFGDSLTYGTGATREHSYPAWLERLIKRRIVNAGVPGELSAQGRERLPRLLKEHKPDLLILCHGGNDLLRRIDATLTRQNLVAMIKQAGSHGIPVILIGVPQPALMFLEAASLYDEIAAEYALPYEGSILPDVEADNTLKSDRIHPNAKGYRRIAEAINRLMISSGALP
jgi:lysophospholipase L1-like esterase